MPLDLGLPDRDGLDALRELRGLSPVPIVVLTARGEETSKVAALDGAEAHLTPKEYDLLAEFVKHAGKVLTHRHLLQHVWLDANADPQYLRVHMRQLRQKIEVRPAEPPLLVTEPGVGCRLRMES